MYGEEFLLKLEKGVLTLAFKEVEGKLEN